MYGDLDDELMLWEVESCTGGIGTRVIPSGPACNICGTLDRQALAEGPMSLDLSVAT